MVSTLQLPLTRVDSSSSARLLDEAHLLLQYLAIYLLFLIDYFLCLFILNFSRILGKFEGTGSANGRPYTYLFRRDIVKTKQMTA